MVRNLWIVALVLAIGVAAVGQVEPLGIVIEPPAGDLVVTITTDKPAYAVGETVRITFTINRGAYIYIWDIPPDGNVTQIFPNGYESQNYFPAGTHTIPSPGRGYSFRVQPPLGTEWLQVLATTTPVSGFMGYSPGDPFPLLGSDPEGWEVQVLGLVPEPTQRAFDFTSFEIVASAPPGYGTLVVRSSPTGARLYVDGMFRGYTPRSVNLLPGFHHILVRETGYGDYTARIYLVAGGTRTLELVLSEMAPANQPPVAQFTYTPPAPRPGDWVRFDGGISYDPDGSIANYEWDFENDGTFDATGQIVFHRYPAAGTYTVLLRVTDNLGASGQVTQAVVVSAPVANQPPVAQFAYAPAAPVAGTAVTFNGTASYDPDGSIVSYSWDLNGDGIVDRTGPVVTWTYPVAGAYSATLYVTDNQGATGQTTQWVSVSQLGIPGMPAMVLPGLYVWGTDSWRITVNGSSAWAAPRAYRIELRTDGQFINVSSDAGPYPLGLVPEPTSEGWRIVFEGTVASGRITHSFQVQNASSIYMDLRLDMDGDGTLDRSPGFVRLRQSMVNPPVNPLVVGSPEGYTGTLVPSLNFRIGSALCYTEFVRIVFWQTTIEALEGM
ncbi:MAG TPA: PKD domain-containing protein [Candidatus Acetothermia bacterium]|nr:PKD domain-containing protein [Candidatus Acetothermia bacterium]